MEGNKNLGPKRKHGQVIAGAQIFLSLFSHIDPQTVPLVSKIETLKETGIQVLRGFFRKTCDDCLIRASGL